MNKGFATKEAQPNPSAFCPFSFPTLPKQSHVGRGREGSGDGGEQEATDQQRSGEETEQEGGSSHVFPLSSSRLV
jgi:hypothetical protein